MSPLWSRSRFLSWGSIHGLIQRARSLEPRAGCGVPIPNLVACIAKGHIVPNRFVRKLEKFEKLSKTDRQAILDVCQNIRKVGARKVMLERGDLSYLFVSGLACRYQMLEDGTRQITDFIVPGDLCNGYAVLPDSGIASLSACSVACRPSAPMRQNWGGE